MPCSLDMGSLPVVGVPNIETLSLGERGLFLGTLNAIVVGPRSGGPLTMLYQQPSNVQALDSVGMTLDPQGNAVWGELEFDPAAENVQTIRIKKRLYDSGTVIEPAHVSRAIALIPALGRIVADDNAVYFTTGTARIYRVAAVAETRQSARCGRANRTLPTLFHQSR